MRRSKVLSVEELIGLGLLVGDRVRTRIICLLMQPRREHLLLLLGSMCCFVAQSLYAGCCFGLWVDESARIYWIEAVCETLSSWLQLLWIGALVAGSPRCRHIRVQRLKRFNSSQLSLSFSHRGTTQTETARRIPWATANFVDRLWDEVLRNRGLKRSV